MNASKVVRRINEVTGEVSFFNGLVCLLCRRRYSSESRSMVCDVCGGELKPTYDYDMLSPSEFKTYSARDMKGMWRFQRLLPVKDSRFIVSLSEGGTPLHRCLRLGEFLGLKNLYVKDETGNPSGSFKDRSISVAVSKGLEWGVKTAVTASTGNVAASVSAYCAKAGVAAYVLVPEAAPEAKVKQSMIYGAKVIRVYGKTTDSAIELAEKAAEHLGWYRLMTYSRANPYTVEGPKTIAYEVCRQLDWQAPDHFFIPVGGGGALAGSFYGFKDFIQLDLIKSVPKLVAVQAEGCMPLVDALKRGLQYDQIRPWPNAETVASGLADAYPRDCLQALKAVRESSGLGVALSDEEILEATRILARLEGIFAEPSGGASIAAVRMLRNQGELDRSDTIVCDVTGTGLKQYDELAEGFELPEPIEPSIDMLVKMLGMEDR